MKPKSLQQIYIDKQRRIKKDKEIEELKIEESKSNIRANKLNEKYFKYNLVFAIINTIFFLTSIAVTLYGIIIIQK
jgi:hypothetical protein